MTTNPTPTIPGPVEAAVAFWRWLRRMRTALWLLGALGLAVLVGTVVPQRPNVPATVGRWLAGTEGPGRSTARVLDAFGFFDVFGAPWFNVLIVLLFTSLTACLIPRIRAYGRMVRRGRPPLAIDLAGQPRVTTFATSAPPGDVHATARRLLGGRRFRVRADGDGTVGADPTRSDPRLGVVPAPADAAPAPRRGPRDQVAAERGHLLREGGSLVFHLSFYLLLVGVVLGQLTSFVGQVAVVEGHGFADTRVAYWTYQPGRWWGEGDHTGFVLDLERFDVEFLEDGSPVHFRAAVVVEPGDGRPVREEDIIVNVPMVVDGMKVHLLDWGYAVRMVVRDGEEVVHDAFVPLTASGPGVWSGVVKAPAAEPQVGLQLDFFADAPLVGGIPQPTGRPEPDAPVALFRAWHGDLRLDRVQNVNRLDTTRMEEVSVAGIRPGGRAEVAGGQVVEFPEVRQWAGFQVSRRPTVPILLVAAVLILIGLIPALYAYRRRVWVAATRDPVSGGSLVTVAGAALQRPQAFEREFDELVAELAGTLPEVVRHDEPEPQREVSVP